MTNKGMLTVEEFSALLDDMRDSHGVAFLCAMFGVRGTGPYEIESCPVSRLGHLLTGRDLRTGYLCIYEGARYDAPGITATPGPATAFAKQFDHNEWPELEEAS